MWPYLRVREAEVAQRRRIYEASFLPALLRRFGPADPISKYLWASPDSPRQLVIAVRYVLSWPDCCGDYLLIALALGQICSHSRMVRAVCRDLEWGEGRSYLVAPWYDRRRAGGRE